jgi:hypothetical protein
MDIRGRAMALAERSQRLLKEMRAGVADAPTLASALVEIAATLSDYILQLKRVSVRVLERNERVRVAGVWSAQPTRVSEGLVVSALATSIPELTRDRPAVIKRVEQLDPALDDVLRREGIWSWISIALTHGEVVRGALSLSSGDMNAFAHGDIGFFVELGSVLGERLLSLASLRTEGTELPATD